jgi:hypothetical protein
MSISVFVLLSAFEDVPRELPPFTLVNAPGSTDEARLEDLFRLLNHVNPGDAARMPTGGKHRSLSCGDIITFVEHDDKRIWLCAPMGWHQVNMEFLVEYEKLSTLDRMRRVRAIV